MKDLPGQWRASRLSPLPIWAENHLNYLTFILTNWRFLAFGMAFQMFASPGHTYFISIFGSELRPEFGLSHGDFGLVFAVATVFSGAVFMYLGRFIDKLDLKLFAVLVCFGLAAAALLTAASLNVFMLGAGIFMLRLMGQGLMPHTTAIAMARYFTDRRGTAISIASVGSTLGLSLFPTIAVTLLALVGWRLGWVALAGLYAIVITPLVFWLLKGHGNRHQHYLELRGARSVNERPGRRESSVADALRDIRFYLILPMLTAPSYILTGFVFHQVFITEAKGWSLTVWAGAFILFAFSSMASSLFFGPLVDRLSALRVMPFILIPLAIVLPLLALFDHTAIIFVFMAGMGATLGGTITIFGAVWPEIWGTTNLGAIRSVGQAFTVFASALAPWVFGLLIDGGMGVAGLAWMNLAHTGIASLLAFLPWFVGTQARDQA